MAKQTATTDAPASVTKLSLRRLPGGGSQLSEVKDSTGADLLKVAKTLVADVRSKLGSNSSKPRVEAVEALFIKYAKSPRDVPPSLDKRMRRPEHVEAIATLDNAWDKAYAEALNDFDQSSVSSGGKIQDAEDDWELAVRVYEAEIRSAAAIFKAKIELARDNTPAPSHKEDQDAEAEVTYYTRSSAISEALVDYEEAKASATTELTTAMGTLLGDIFEGVTTTAVAEATLIDAIQKASATFWEGVDTELTTAR